MGVGLLTPVTALAGTPCSIVIAGRSSAMPTTGPLPLGGALGSAGSRKITSGPNCLWSPGSSAVLGPLVPIEQASARSHRTSPFCSSCSTPFDSRIGSQSYRSKSEGLPPAHVTCHASSRAVRWS
eukprot:scaffold7688_cov130-Isochrysis_galbana.AAC.17